MILVPHKNLTNILYFSAVVLCALNIFIWQSVFAASQKPELKVSFLDVGQGDSELVETRDGTQILIDGGPSRSILSILGNRMPFYDRHIDVVILTHPHADHVTGLV